MKMKIFAAAAAMLASSSAFAGATGNAGVVSDYLFRGVEQSLGGGSAQVFGGLDYAHESGAYVGTWISSLDSSTYETDLYAGFSNKLASGLAYDVGYIFYGYRDGNSLGFGKGHSLNYSEVYGGLSYAGLSGKVFYSPEFGITQDSAVYVTANYALAFSETLSLTPQIGYSDGDGIKNSYGFKNYEDYSLTLAKTLEGGFTFTLGVFANSERKTLGTESVIVGLKKSFDL